MLEIWTLRAEYWQKYEEHFQQTSTEKFMIAESGSWEIKMRPTAVEWMLKLLSAIH